MNIIVVDCETNGLNPPVHQCVEVAWWNLNTGDRDVFIPPHDTSNVLANASIKALQINRYIDRIAGQAQDTRGVHGRALSNQLHDHTLAAKNPAFEEKFLTPMFEDYERAERCGIPEWHYRTWDLGAYAAGVLRLDHVPGLVEVCELLSTSARPDHSAEGDVSATGECFLELFDRTGVKLS
ncbi:MAG: hypothetical protein ACREQ5_01040 [Candidatus Dormibacteria bacterium]